VKDIRMMTSRVLSPCYKCSDRSVGCHSVCERYKQYRKEVDKIREQYRHDRNLDYTEYQKTRRDQYAHATIKNRKRK
jgi:hypothetical protein